ncbi:hypothetical protein B0H14DRAFT_2638116 [Mycena olivaceomarginata]|nr:hypothetical protein B0H14DRAFT_2638116 [Mycena olivaceomarginata]
MDGVEFKSERKDTKEGRPRGMRIELDLGSKPSAREVGRPYRLIVHGDPRLLKRSAGGREMAALDSHERRKLEQEKETNQDRGQLQRVARVPQMGRGESTRGKSEMRAGNNHRSDCPALWLCLALADLPFRFALLAHSLLAKEYYNLLFIRSEEVQRRCGSASSNCYSYKNNLDRRRRSRMATTRPCIGLHAVPVTGTAVVSTGPERERTCFTKGIHGIFNRLWRVFQDPSTRRWPFSTGKAVKNAAKEPTERDGMPVAGPRRTGATGTVCSPNHAPPRRRARTLARRPAKQRLLELENERRLEDAEALKFTNEQRISLFLSFQIHIQAAIQFSVAEANRRQTSDRSHVRGKVSLFPPAPPRRPVGRPLPLPIPANPAPHRHAGSNPPVRSSAFAARQCALLLLPVPAAPPHFYSSPPSAASEAFALLTNAHLVSFGTDDTICVRRLSYSSPASTHSAQAVAFPVSPHRYASAPTPTPTYTSTLSPLTSPWMPPIVWSASSLPTPVRTSPTSGGKPRSCAKEKRRSPVQGLPPFSLSSASSALATQTTTPCPIRVPLPPLISVDGDAPEEGDEDADDEDEGMTVVDDRDHAEDGDEELPTPRQHPRRRAACVLREQGGGEEPQTPVPHSYEREATPPPYSEAEREREREGEQVGGKREL